MLKYTLLSKLHNTKRNRQSFMAKMKIKSKYSCLFNPNIRALRICECCKRAVSRWRGCTSVLHFCVTLLCYTSVSHFCVIFLCYTSVLHFFTLLCYTFFTLLRYTSVLHFFLHFCVTILCFSPAGVHFCGAQGIKLDIKVALASTSHNWHCC